MAVTGNVPVNLIGRDSFQEVDITGITMPITKHNYIVKDVNHPPMSCARPSRRHRAGPARAGGHP